MPIGVVTALPAEAASFCGRRPGIGADSVLELEGALLCCCGMGALRAGAAAEALAGRGVTGLMSWGIAGGLRAEIRAGDLLVSDVVRDSAGARWICDPAWRRNLQALLQQAGLSVRGGPLLTTDAVVGSAADKRRLAATGAFGVDMESAAVAKVAASAGLPFVVLRAVCDEARHAVPRAALEAVDEAGRLRPGRLAWNLVRSPADWRSLLRLRRGLRAARRTLRHVARERPVDMIGPPGYRP